MRSAIDLTELLLKTWKTTNQVSVYLVMNIQPVLWNKPIPGYPRKTIATLAIHLHNTRCTWIKSLCGEENAAGIHSNQATRKEVVTALNQSNKAMAKLLRSCIDNGGTFLHRPAWLNFPNDVVHLLAYFVAHEAHHRGQIVMAARQLGKPFSREMSGELWQWNKRLKEFNKTPRPNRTHR